MLQTCANYIVEFIEAFTKVQLSIIYPYWRKKMQEYSGLSLIEELSNANGVSGFEDEVLKVARQYIPADMRVVEDSLRNLFFYRKENTGGKPVIQIDAHSDEVGFMVQAIKPNGTIKFIQMGNWVANNIPAHKVRVRNAEGSYISGIVASKPPHFMTESERTMPVTIDQMAIDIGASSREEAIEDYKIQIGAPIVPDVIFEYDSNHDIMIGKAFDCRLGCASIFGTLNALEGESLKVDIVGAMSVQEEVGMRGASVTVNRVKPDIAIVFEGCPADDTVMEPYMIQTAIKQGPMLRHIDARMITNPRYQRFALNLAKERGIPVQESVRTGGATNGAPIHLTNLGIPAIVIGLPVRYIHSHHGIASFADYLNAVKLAAEICKKLDQDLISSF